VRASDLAFSPRNGHPAESTRAVFLRGREGALRRRRHAFSCYGCSDLPFSRPGKPRAATAPDIRRRSRSRTSPAGSRAPRAIPAVESASASACASAARPAATTLGRWRSSTSRSCPHCVAAYLARAEVRGGRARSAATNSDREEGRSAERCTSHLA